MPILPYNQRQNRPIGTRFPMGRFFTCGVEVHETRSSRANTFPRIRPWRPRYNSMRQATSGKGGADEPGQRERDRRVQEVHRRAQRGAAGDQRHAEQARPRRALLRRQGRRRRHRPGRHRRDAAPGDVVDVRQDRARGVPDGREAGNRGGAAVRPRRFLRAERPPTRPTAATSPAWGPRTRRCRPRSPAPSS